MESSALKIAVKMNFLADEGVDMIWKQACLYQSGTLFSRQKKKKIKFGDERGERGSPV